MSKPKCTPQFKLSEDDSDIERFIKRSDHTMGALPSNKHDNPM